MIKTLIKKEFLLSAHPMTYVMAFFGCMLLIPSYPYYVAFFYTTLGIFFAFLNSRENRDLYYTAFLPVSKNDIVKSKLLFAVIVELVSLIFAVPFAFLTAKINPNGGNTVGIEANVAFFGFVFIMYSIFNSVFLCGFFKSGYKVGKSYLISSIIMFVYVAVLEVAVHFPKIGAYLDTTEKQVAQLPILVLGMVIYVISAVLTCKKSQKSFEKVDL